MARIQRNPAEDYRSAYYVSSHAEEEMLDDELTREVAGLEISLAFSYLVATVPGSVSGGTIKPKLQEKPRPRRFGMRYAPDRRLDSAALGMNDPAAALFHFMAGTGPAHLRS